MILVKTLKTSDSINILIVLGIIISIIILIAIIKAINEKINAIVKKNSTYVKEIINLNLKYKFNTIYPISDKKIFYLKSKRQFDSFDYNKNGSAYIQVNRMRYEKIIEKIESNRKLLENYKDVLRTLKNTNDISIAKKCKMTLKSFVKRENKIVSKLIKKPLTNYSIIFCWEYTSPAGRKHYSSSCVFDYDSIKLLVKPRQRVYADTDDYQYQTPVNNRPSVSLDDIEDLED